MEPNPSPTPSMNFLTDPLNLMNREPTLLDIKGSFQMCKSFSATFFLRNDESFLVVPSSEGEWPEQTYSISVFNLNQMVLENSIKVSENIVFIRAYPEINAKYIYCGGCNGEVKILEIPKTKGEDFREIAKFSEGLLIYSGVMFEDKFGEIDADCKATYLIIAPSHKSFPLNMWRIKSDGTGVEKFKKIENTISQSCYTLNYYYDEATLKTCVFGGFSNSYVSQMNLKSGEWSTEKYETINDVSSINFIISSENGI